jgi:glycosyltransferase involved in cell wall biosynthesis
MKVIHIVHGRANPDAHNGISRVVYHMNKQEKLQGCDSQIWAIVDRTKTHYSYQRDEFVTVECFPRVWLPFAHHEIIDQLLAQKDSIDLVHFHLIWFYDKNIIAKALKKAGIPFIITTHGTYSKPHAYTGKRLLAKWLFELDYLNMATEIHAITREEGTGLQRYGYNGRSFVAYNGIDPNEIPKQCKKDFFANKPYQNKIKLIWVGVFREDKNIRSLIQAVAMLPIALREQFVCVLVGPDYRGNAAKYAALAQELGCSEQFDYIGPLYGQDKYDAIESADVNVMPSFSEGFSMALLDTMACAKPSLLTSGCAMNYFYDFDFFIRCEPYPQDIERGLQEIFKRQQDWQLMGNNARKLVNTELCWDSITRVMLSNYKRIVEGINNVD